MTEPYVLTDEATAAAHAAAAAAPPLTEEQKARLARLFALPALRSTA